MLGYIIVQKKDLKNMIVSGTKQTSEKYIIIIIIQHFFLYMIQQSYDNHGNIQYTNHLVYACICYNHCYKCRNYVRIIVD